jgi:hypothetical protein
MWGHYDEWGYPDIERNKAEIEAERKNRKGENRASIIRKKPNTIKECFTLSGKDCFFNSDILDIRLETFVFGNKYLTKGNFQWKEGMKDGFVEFLPSEKGRFNLSYLFDKPEKSNQFTMMGGVKVPSNIDKFRAGADPFRLDVTKDSRNSKFGFGVFMLRDWAIDNPSVVPYEIDGEEIKINHITERFCCTYEHRPPTLSEACEDILMACVYFGCQVFPELNVDYVQRYFQQRGYAGYLLHKQNDRTGKHDENAGDTTTAALKTDIYTWYFDHIERNGMREVHDDLLRQLREIDNDMTDYDLFVGCGYAGLASKKVGEAQNYSYDLADIFPDYV